MRKHNYFVKIALAIITLASWMSVQAAEIRIPIAADSDDAEQDITSGEMDLSSSDLELIQDGGSIQYVGLRFTDIAIPDGEITNIYIQFTTDETDIPGDNKDPFFLNIWGEATDNSTTFGGGAFNISNRDTTSARVNWGSPDASVVPFWTVTHEAGIDQRTPNLLSIFNEITSRPGWTEGSPITFIMNGVGERCAESFNGADANTEQRPTLVIEYVQSIEAVTTPNSDIEQSLANGVVDFTSTTLDLVNDATSTIPQIVGLKFDNLDIPKRATIDNAYIQFTAASASGVDTINIAILTYAEGNPRDFQALEDFPNDDLNTDDIAVWNPEPWTVVDERGEKQRTTDLKAMVQSVVNLADWNRGGDMKFLLFDPSGFFSGFEANVGMRVVHSADAAVANPSFAPQLVIEFSDPTEAPAGVFPIDFASFWSYTRAESTLGAEFATEDYNRITWPFAEGPIGYGYDVNATVDSTYQDEKVVTYYFAQDFVVNNTFYIDTLLFDMKLTDGAVFYLNGQEVGRYNMPQGAIDSSTLALSQLTGDSIRFSIVNEDYLQNGTNTIGVEVHLADAADTSLTFDLALSGAQGSLEVSDYPLNKFSGWSYNDLGIDLGTSWRTADASDWLWGLGSLGYNNGDNTPVSFGPDGNDKYPTAYFRKTINVADINDLADSVIVGLKADDGAVVYINGQELFRTANMPVGEITYNTLAESSASDDGRNYNQYRFATSETGLVVGLNEIAVEVHQNSPSSSDMSFGMEIINAFRILPPDEALGCNGPNDDHFSCFTSIAPASQDPNIYIPETHDFQLITKEGDAYTTQVPNVPATVGGNNDFTGYVSPTGSSTQGYVSINHETSPGGVTIADIEFNSGTNLWDITNTQGVDFSGIAGTQRNCSGGVTPWGTIITSEETGSASDANNDGYLDLGWQVEIDPVLKTVANNGQKLWALGKFSHENIVVADDEITAYEGEDAGNGILCKFIADQPRDLTTGTLYTLVLDDQLVGDGNPPGTTGRWVEVPNSTVQDRNSTKSLAIGLGATTFSGIEDVEINPVTGKIYFTAKGHDATYRFTDNGDGTISDFEIFVGQMSYFLNLGNDEIVTEPWSNGNDNLVFDNRGNLYVLQDGDRDHIWMVTPNHTQMQPEVQLFMRTPAGSEPCGMTFTPDNKYAFVSIQHPSGNNASTSQTDAAGNEVTFEQSTTIVVARKEFLGNSIITSLDEMNETEVLSIYPNPVSSGTFNVVFNTEETSEVVGAIYNLAGVKLGDLVNDVYAAGAHTVVVDATELNLTEGMYMVNLRVGAESHMQTLIIE